MVSHDDAVATLESAQTSESRLSPLVVDEMSRIIAGYKAGKLIYVPEKSYVISVSPVQNPLTPVLEEVASLDVSAASEIKYLDEDITPAPDSPDMIFQKVSDMDPEALKRSVPVGRISPPMVSAKFICNELRIPVANGFVYGRGYGDYPDAALRNYSGENVDSATYEIEHPNLPPGVLGVPLSTKVVEANDDLGKLSKPTKQDPAVWRAAKTKGNVKYKLASLNEDEVGKIDISKLRVKKDEQMFWRYRLPLPLAVQARIDLAKKNGDHKEIVSLLTSFITQEHDGKTNFRYVCNPRLGRFFQENADDLPLLMNELKVGHCDLHSWYIAAQLRAQGVPAFVTTEAITTKDGKSFNDSYLHATVLVAMSDGSLMEYDPTSHIHWDNSFHPSVMSDDLIDTLEDRLLEAETNQEKAEIIRGFNKEILPALRKEARGNSDVKEDFIARSHGALSAYLGEARFDDSVTRIMGDAARLDSLPRVVTPDSILEVLALYDASKGMDWTSISESSKVRREQASWLFRAFYDKRIACYASETRVNEYFFFEDRTATLEEVIRVLKDESYNRVGDYSTLEGNFTTGLLYDYYDSRVGFGKRMESCSLEEACSGDYLSINNKPDSFWRSYSYSPSFLDGLQKDEYVYHLGIGVKNLWNFSNPASGNKELTCGQKEYFMLKRDFFVFAVELQLACTSPEYENAFCEKLGLDKIRFRKLLKSVVKSPSVDLDNSGIKEKYKDERAFFDPVSLSKKKPNDAVWACVNGDIYLDLRERARFRKAVLRTIAEVDSRASFTTRFTYGDFREYSQGDDAKRISEPLYARSGQNYVNLMPTREMDHDNQLHVCIETSRAALQSLKNLELIRILQEDSRAKNRTVYISNEESSYFKLPLNMQPQEVLTLLTLMDQGANNLFLKGGKPPRNLLYVSGSQTNTLATKYLYQGVCNFHAINLRGKEFTVHPLVSKRWVEHGSK